MFAAPIWEFARAQSKHNDRTCQKLLNQLQCCVCRPPRAANTCQIAAVEFTCLAFIHAASQYRPASPLEHATFIETVGRASYRRAISHSFHCIFGLTYRRITGYKPAISPVAYSEHRREISLPIRQDERSGCQTTADRRRSRSYHNTPNLCSTKLLSS